MIIKIDENSTKKELLEKLNAIRRIIQDQYCSGCDRWHTSNFIIKAISLILNGNYKEFWEKWTWFKGNETLDLKLKFLEKILEK